MIYFDEALEIIRSHTLLQDTEQVEYMQCLSRILAEDVISDTDFPPFNKSAMDGYALKEIDLNKQLDVVDRIAAGEASKIEVQQGQAAKIMTGAPVPKGADFVIEIEFSEQVNGKVHFSGKAKNNIISQASQVKKGQVVLQKGTKIEARHFAILASVGKTKVQVYQKPKIGIISTGSEIVEPDIKPKESQIRNSNGHQLIAQVLDSGATPEYYGIISDSYEQTQRAIIKGLAQCDVLLLTGGVSMGDFDFVPDILKELDIQIHFNRVAVKPGKPVVFGTKRNKAVFGLPGNPVSSFMQFELLVKPYIGYSMNYAYQEQVTRVELAENYSRKDTKRRAHVPVILVDNKVVFSNYKGSSHIHALADCVGFVVLEVGESELIKGELIDVRLF